MPQPVLPPPPTPRPAAAPVLTPHTGEAWEEAGVIGRVTRSLGDIQDSRIAFETTSTKKGHTRTLYQFFEFLVEKEEAQWPEMHKRKRKWLTYKEAVQCFKQMNRPELKEAIDRSSVLKY